MARLEGIGEAISRDSDSSSQAAAISARRRLEIKGRVSNTVVGSQVTLRLREAVPTRRKEDLAGRALRVQVEEVEDDEKEEQESSEGKGETGGLTKSREAVEAEQSEEGDPGISMGLPGMSMPPT